MSSSTLTSDFELMAFHFSKYDVDFRKRRKSSRKKDWRPIRFAVRDVILGAVVTRHNTTRNILECDVFLSHNPKVFESYSGAKLCAIYILSDAFQCGSTMEIRFTTNFGREARPVPPDVVDLAFEYGVKLSYAKQGYLTSSEAMELYFAITDFSPQARARAAQLHRENKISVPRLCFSIHHADWSLEEMEMILLSSDNPQGLLLGTTSHLARLLWLQDLQLGRNALLGSFLTRKLQQRELPDSDADIVIEIEANDRQVDVGFDPRFFAKTYHTHELIAVDWLPEGKTLAVDADQDLVVFVCARDHGYMGVFYKKDLAVAREMAAAYDGKTQHLAMLVPVDFYLMSDEDREAMMDTLEQAGVSLLICPETIESIDMAVIDKMERSKVTRR